jgi:RNA polymerase sigma factor (sigma-70 family)
MIYDGEVRELVGPVSHLDAATLESLLIRYEADLLAYAARHIPFQLKSVLAPDDVVQDTFFEAFRRLREFDARHPDLVVPWLKTVARNRIINAVHEYGTVKRGGQRVQAENELPENGGSLTDILAELAVHTRTPSRSAIAHELAAALEESISQLRPDYQRAIRLRYIDGEAVEAIAIAIGRTSRAVHMVCNRALKALHRELRSRSRFS